MPADSADLRFTAVAPRVLRRVIFRRTLAMLSQTSGIAAIGIVVSLIATWLVHGSLIGWLPLALLATWLVAVAVAAHLQRPDEYSALALWDQASERREAFANAWWFEQQATLSDSQQAHITAQCEILPEALGGLNAALPLTVKRSLWIAPVIAAVSMLLPQVFGTRVIRETMNRDMLQAAKDAGKKLGEKDWEKKQLAGLTQEEKKELDKLKESLKETAKDLENSGGKDAREVLSALEQRARDAEKLAAQLGNEKEAWASEKMVSELRKHADTADLGDSVADKKADNTAKAAEALANQLKSSQLTNESRERINETLKAVQKEAEKEDRQRTVGENVLAASDQMQATKPVDASKEFEKLAEKMREIARREQTKKELEKLAQQLRDAGSSITGQSNGGMQQMAEAGQQSNSQQSGQMQQVPQSNPQQGQNGSQPLMPPGLGQNQNQQMGQNNQSPVPGTGQQQQLPMMTAQQPGQGQGQGDGNGDGKPMLFAPVPGMKPGDKPDALMLGPQGQGGQPDALIGMSNAGGLPPGAGTADLNNKPTEKQAISNQSMVAAQKNNEGQSSVRAVEGGVKKEQAARSATTTALQAISAEEEALDDQALPPSRREQVRRYFTELRKRFEKSQP